MVVMGWGHEIGLHEGSRGWRGTLGWDVGYLEGNDGSSSGMGMKPELVHFGDGGTRRLVFGTAGIIQRIVWEEGHMKCREEGVQPVCVVGSVLCREDGVPVVYYEWQMGVGSVPSRENGVQEMCCAGKMGCG